MISLSAAKTSVVSRCFPVSLWRSGKKLDLCLWFWYIRIFCCACFLGWKGKVLKTQLFLPQHQTYPKTLKNMTVSYKLPHHSTPDHSSTFCFRKKVPRSTSFGVRALTWWVGWRRGAPGQSPSHKSSGTPWMPRTAAAHLAGHLPPQAGERCHQCIGRKQCPGQHPNQLQPSQWRSQRQWRTKQGSTRSPHQQMLPVVSPRWPRSKLLRFQCLL